MPLAERVQLRRGAMLGSRVVRLRGFAWRSFERRGFQRGFEGFRAAADPLHIPVPIGFDSDRRHRGLTRILHHILCTAVAILAAAILARATPSSSLPPPVLLLGWVALLVVTEIARHALSLPVKAGENMVEFTSALTVALEEVDPYTRRHSARVAAYAERLARELGLPEGEVRAIRLAGLLHDVGKVAQERALLQKTGPLDPEERTRIESHPAAGAEILGRVRALRGVAVLVRHHHERPDGCGYPGRLRGEAIPVGSRVVLVADAFDAMTSDRPYRRALSGERAVAELCRHAGTQFDQRVVETLANLRARGRFEIIEPEGGNGAADQAVGRIGGRHPIHSTP